MTAEKVRAAFNRGYLLTHSTTGKMYKPVGIGKSKVNGEWVESLTYKPFNSLGLFTRSTGDFANFTISE